MKASSAAAHDGSRARKLDQGSRSSAPSASARRASGGGGAPSAVSCAAASSAWRQRPARAAASRSAAQARGSPGASAHGGFGEHGRLFGAAGAQQKGDHCGAQRDVGWRAAETLAQQRLGPTIVGGHRRRLGEDRRVGVLGARRPREPLRGLALTEPGQHPAVVQCQPAIVGAVRAAHLDRLLQLARGVGQLAGRRVNPAERRCGAPPQAVAVEGQGQRPAERIARRIDPSQPGQRLAERAPGRRVAAVQIDRASERRDRLLESAPPCPQLAERQKRLGCVG